MKQTKLDITVDEDADSKLHELKARHDVPVPRLRGMAVERFVENGDVDDYIEDQRGENQ